jgi:hypothetical protein
MNNLVKFGHANNMFYLNVEWYRSVAIFYHGGIRIASDPKTGYDHANKDCVLSVMGTFLVKEIKPAIAEQV